MSDERVTKVTESIDGAVMEEIGSPDGEHLEEVYIDEPDIALVHDGEVIEYDLDSDEEEEVETVEAEPIVEEVETVEEVIGEETVEASPEGEVEVTPEGAPETDAEGASPTTETEREPFSLRMDGQEVEVPGAYVEGDVVTIPREEFQRVVQPRLADRNVWIEERRGLLQQIEDLSPERNPEVVKANALLEKIEEAFADEDSAYAFFRNFDKNRDRLLLDADRAAFEAEKARVTSTQDRVRQETEATQIQTEMDSALSTVLSTAADLDQYSGVDFDHVRSLIDETKNSFFFRAAEDLPQFGLKKGEVGINIEKIEKVIQAEAARSRRLDENRAATQRNASVIGESTEEVETAPPTPEPDTPQVSSGSPPDITSKEDWESHLAAVAAGR